MQAEGAEVERFWDQTWVGLKGKGGREAGAEEQHTSSGGLGSQTACGFVDLHKDFHFERQGSTRGFKHREQSFRSHPHGDGVKTQDTME